MKRTGRKAIFIFGMAVIIITVCLFGDSEVLSAANLKVMTVPANINDSSQPHYTYNGHLTTFKAIVQGTDPNAQYYYRWDINGDGAWDQLEGKTYANANGQWYIGKGADLSGKGYLLDIQAEQKLVIGTIEVATDINSYGVPVDSAFGSYPVLQYRDLSPAEPTGFNNAQLSILKSIAMEDALWYLHQQLVQVGASGIGATGYISNKATNETNDVRVANTALFVLAMAENGHYGAFPAASNLFNTSGLNERNDALYNNDPYAEDIARAVNYLLNNLAEMPVSDLDKSDDGVTRIGGTSYSGLYIPYNSVPEINCSSLTLAAFAKSGLTGSTVAANSSLVNGLPFELIIQRMVDAGVASQIDESSVIEAQGGWTYFPVNNNQVVTAAGVNPLISGGWIYALHTAEKETGASGVYINNRLKDRLANHILYAQNTDGGCKFADRTDSVFSPAGNYLLACKWLGWDKWDASDTADAGYTHTALTKGQARQVYDRYLQYVINNWEESSVTNNLYGGCLWESGIFDSAVRQACFSGASNSNLVAKSLYGIKNFAEYDESPILSFGSNDWKRQFSVSLIKGQHSLGYYKEEIYSSLDQYYLGFPGTTAYAAMAGGNLYPEAISEVSLITSSLTGATTGLAYSHNLTATGGLPENYVWHISGLPEGLEYDSNTGVISGMPILAGNYTLNVSVSDSISTDSATLVLSVQVGELAIITNSLLDSIAGEFNSFNLTAIGGVAPYTWETQNLPSGLSLNAATGVISGIPIETGDFSINVTVTDSISSVAQKTISLRLNAYRPLTITTTELPVAYLSSPYNTIMKANGGKAMYNWSASGIPEGLMLNESTGDIGGIPLSEGTYPVSITVEDSAGTTAQVNLPLTVRTVNITTSELPPVFYGETDQPYNASMTVTGGQEPYTWSCAAYFQIFGESTSLPSGLAFDPVTGVLQGVIRPGIQPQPCYLKIRATDAAGKFDEKQYLLNAYPDFAHIITQSIPNGFIGQEYSARLEADNVYNDISFIWSAKNLPNGFSINETTGIISGTTAAAGEYRITVTVHLPGDSRTVSQMLFFYILEPLIIDTPSLPQGTVNTGYVYKVESHGGMIPWQDECTWSAFGLPSGLSINETTGTIYGVPSEAGVFTVYLGAYDSDGNYASKQLDMTISDAIDECFIATAAYGSINQQPVVLLRQFRDQFLLTNSWGQAFVQFYYHNSPSIARFIADSECLKLLVKALLSPVILVVFLIFHPVWGLILFSLFICIMFVWRKRLKDIVE